MSGLMRMPESLYPGSCLTVHVLEVAGAHEFRRVRVPWWRRWFA